jgi:hypothetical protein
MAVKIVKILAQIALHVKAVRVAVLDVKVV